MRAAHARRRAPRRAHLVVRRRSARPRGTVGTEDSPHRGSYMSVYERSKHEGEVAALRRGQARRDRARRGQPVLGPGPGPRGRHRPDPDRLPQRQAEGVRRHADQHRRHRRRGRGARARRPSAGSDGERYLISGATITSQRGAGARHPDLRRAATTSASSRRSSRAPSARPSRAASARAGKHAAGVPRDDQHDAARPPLRRLARRRRARVCATRRSRTRSAARSSGRAPKDSYMR